MRELALNILQEETDGFESQSRLRDDVLDAMIRFENETEQCNIADVSNAERTLNDFFAYLDGLGDKFDSNSLEGHKRDWLKSFNDC